MKSGAGLVPPARPQQRYHRRARCYALLPYQDKLLVAGGFWYAGGVSASRFATWDGLNWCGTADEWDGYGESLTMFNDTLFMASGYGLNSVPVNRIAKWINGPIEGNLCTTVGIDHRPYRTETTIFPDPAIGDIQITSPKYPNRAFDVLDAQGRIVHQGQLDAYGSCRLEVSHFKPGMYCVRLKRADQRTEAIRFIKE